jgi:outer membrane protein
MKSSFLIVWNVVLTVVLAALLLVQLNKGKIPVTDKPATTATDTSRTMAGKLPIAVIYIDSLQNNYTLFVTKKKELELKQTQIEATVDRKVKDLQSDYATAQQTAQTMTQQQLAETEQRLQRKQADIQQLQSQLSNDLQKQLDQFNQELKDSLDSFLKGYNASNKYNFVFSVVDGGTDTVCRAAL